MYIVDVTDVGLMTAVNIERLSKLGKLMDRTIADRDGSGAVVPLPPPPPPAFPDPPTYEEEEPEEKASIASSGVARMGGKLCGACDAFERLCDACLRSSVCGRVYVW
jgi:hypothetical protein